MGPPCHLAPAVRGPGQSATSTVCPIVRAGVRIEHTGTERGRDSLEIGAVSSFHRPAGPWRSPASVRRSGRPAPPRTRAGPGRITGPIGVATGRPRRARRPLPNSRPGRRDHLAIIPTIPPDNDGNFFPSIPFFPNRRYHNNAMARNGRAAPKRRSPAPKTRTPADDRARPPPRIAPRSVARTGVRAGGRAQDPGGEGQIADERPQTWHDCIHNCPPGRGPGRLPTPGRGLHRRPPAPKRHRAGPHGTGGAGHLEDRQGRARPPRAPAPPSAPPRPPRASRTTTRSPPWASG